MSIRAIKQAAVAKAKAFPSARPTPAPSKPVKTREQLAKDKAAAEERLKDQMRIQKEREAKADVYGDW